MTHARHCHIWALALGASFLADVQAIAQTVGVRTISIGAGMEDFTYAGGVGDVLRYDYRGPAIAVFYTQSGHSAYAALGARSPLLFDIGGSGWINLRALTVPQHGFSVPVILSLGHRRVERTGGIRWDASRLGIGAGVLWTPARTGLTVRLAPMLTLVSTTLSIEYALAFGAEMDMTLLVLKLGPGKHLELGYMARFQQWDIRAPAVLQNQANRAFDYRSVTHLLRSGIRF